MNLGSAINSAGDEFFGCISEDGCSLYFSTSLTQSGGYFYGGDIYVTTRATKDSPWGPPVNLGLLPSRGGSGNWDPSLSADGLALFFGSDYPSQSLWPNIWLTTRTSNGSSWGTAILLGPEINTSNDESRPSISDDGHILYFCSNRPGGSGGLDIWQAPIIPIVDFNGDEKVDLKDFSKLAQYWRQNESSVDMGPMPWGDGIVDTKDLTVLAEHWLEEIGLIAHWKLDEAEGGVAKDIVGNKDGTLNGNPIWQPQGGKVGGALEFDGDGDYVSTPFIRDPSAGAFSVFAWVKGGGSEQAIISQAQAGGVNWLAAGTSQGKLMTELKAAGRFGTPLFSEAVIIDGQWHRVGLTWDGSTRTLYVDGTEVAKGTQASLAGSTGGLNIGAGKNLDPGSFWSGLIDDVRIYDRAVTP